MTATPLIELRDITRSYPAGEGTIDVLKNISLTIDAGEQVAIIGASGSGKSTLMNILGCLDRPTKGTYLIEGRTVSELGPDELAALRRDRFGFIFQRYHLLAELSALDNVEIPAIYAGATAEARRRRSARLLERLGMGERLQHRPGQLSGGQQQRVSIARALMNDAEVILADEPTGALDTQSGQEVLSILDELGAEGRTVIVVTHDPRVAARSSRVIEISDGRIVSDRRSDKGPGAALDIPGREAKARPRLFAFAARFRESFRMAVVALAAHRLRTLLTMLGIVIGIASVVSMVALGTGSQQQVLDNISSLGTNTLEIYPGTGFGDTRADRITTLVVSDADALATQPFVAAVTPTVTANATLRYAAEEASAQITGVGAQYFDAAGVTLLSGRVFGQEAVAGLAQVAVIDTNTRNALFDGLNPLGQVILADQAPLRVIGVVQSQSRGPGGGQSLSVFAPYTAVQTRLTGSTTLRSITVRVDDDTGMDSAEAAVNNLLTLRHGSKDFFIINTDDIRETITSTSKTMTLLISAVAVISLIVGGIGVMNIMLVSVSERVGEIGVRMAVGARQSDILQQFLIEAVLVCLLGGVIGIVGALAVGQLAGLFGSSYSFIYSSASILLAFICSSLIGIVFGFLPARNASRLDPVQALSKG
jgi:macrolide transport system ATP-binding/permease protein